MIALRFKSFAGSVYLLVFLPLLPAKPHSSLFLTGAAGNSAREDKMRDEHDTSEQYYLPRSTKVCKRKPQLRQQNNRSKSYSNKPTSPPLVNGHTNYFSLTGDDFYENGHEDNDGVEEDKNSSHRSRVLVDSVAHADFSLDEDNGNSDNAVGESNRSENKDGHCILNGDSSKDAECQTGGANELGDRHGHDVDGNDGANVGNDNADHDDDNDGANASSTVENDDDSYEDGDNGYRGCDNHHHPHHHCAGDEHSDGGGGDGNKDSGGDRAPDRADVKDDSIHGKFIRDSNFDNEDKNDAAADDDENKNDDAESEDVVSKSSSLPVDSIVPGKSVKDFKLATKDTKLSLPVNAGLDDQVKSRTIGTTAGDNNDNKKPPGARAKTLLTSNEFTAKVPTTSYPPSLKPKTSSSKLPRGNWAELDYLYKSRIPSLEATGINQKFLARHTTDQSLQHVSQTGDFNLLKNSTPRAEWPMWSLPPPDASETGHRWRHSSGLHPSVVGSQTGGQSNWQFWDQPSREMNSSNLNPQEQKSFNCIDPWFSRGAEAFTGLRISDSLPATNGTISGSLFNTHAAMASAHEPKRRYLADNSYGSHLNSPTYRGLPVRDGPPVSRLPTVKSHAPVVCPSVTTSVTVLQPTASVTSQSVPSYSYQSNVLSENGQERFMEPSMPNSFTENQEPIISSASRREEQRAGTDVSSLEFPDDPSLAALERKVAEACAVVERVMKEREERTKAQREAARKKREMREQREREAREMREREERERREREERERKEREEREREDRKMRERQEREIREREERDRREQIENEDRDTRWFGGERAPVQESPRWQCEHYQRRCLVKFPCCGIFYPCHRCHNTSGACDTDDRKANNATHVKCGVCGHEEEVSVCHN